MTPAQARSVTYNLDIPAQAMGDALQALALASQHKLLYDPELVEGKSGPPLKGEFTAEEAVKRLLSGTNLSYEVTSSGLVLIRPSSAGASSSGFQSPSATLVEESNRIRLAQSETPTPPRAQTQGPTAEKVSQDSSRSTERQQLEEVVVTARKKSERLLDVPIPLSVTSAEELLKSNKTRLEDYFAQIPGLTANTLSVSIRGLSMGSLQNPTVATTIDDVSFGSSTFNGGFGMPIVDPADLESIEVLRGPQGSLYGAASIGGLIRYVTADPSTIGFSGRVRVGSSMIRNGNNAGYNVNGSVNVPLSDTLAIRASALSHREPGYIDNPLFGTKGINESRTYGGTVAALWSPSDVFSLKLSAMYQDSRTQGTEDTEPSLGFGEFQQNRLAGTGKSATEFQAYSARLRAKFGLATLTSITGYNISRIPSISDFTAGYITLVDFTEDAFGVPNGTTGVASRSTQRLKKFTQEMRLEMPLGRKIDWLLGAYYGRERSFTDNDFPSIVTTTGDIVGNWGEITSQSPYTDEAVFTDFTVHLTDRFELQVGGRESRIDQSFNEIDSGLLVPLVFFSPSPSTVSTHNRGSAFTYSLTPQLKLSPNLMTYLRLASGYSPGGANANSDRPGVPKSFAPSKTLNYELGIKGEVLDNLLAFDASLYYISWRDIAVTLSLVQPDGQIDFYTGNAGAAKSQGVELSMQVRPATGLTLGGWVAFGDASLTEDSPSAGSSGDPLPFAMRRSANFSIDQEFPLGPRMTGSVGGTLSYVGRRTGNFNSIPPEAPRRQVYPSYSTLDLHAELRLEPWTIQLYSNNVTDKRGLLDGGLASLYPTNLTYIAPRSVGLSIGRTF